MKHSRLEVIKIDKGNVKTLETDLFPVTVKDLTLKEMGIEKLPDSFENLENLCVLSFEKSIERSGSCTIANGNIGTFECV